MLNQKEMEILEQKEIHDIIQERKNNDNGKRYTLEEIEKEFNLKKES